MKKNLFTLIVFAAVIMLASCKKGPDDQPGGDNGTKNCTTKGKFESVACGWGLYQNYWIRLDDGTLLQPCQSDVPALDMRDIYEGMPVELGYYGIKNSYCPESPITCLAMPPAHETVRITCLKSLGKPRCPEENECNQMGVLYDWSNKLDGCGWIIKLNTGETLEVLDTQIDRNQFEDETPVIVGFNKVKRYTSCMVGTPVDLTCIRVANTTTVE